jgi:D-alanine--poly(phosphoribitol) ligase subunit 2
MEQQIRAALKEAGRLPVDVDSLSLDDDLFKNGLTSLAQVNVMLAVEEYCDVELTDDLLNRETFRSIRSLMYVVAQLSVNVVNV